MDIRDHTHLARALAKASLQPGISAITLEQCTYQIGLVLARSAQHFDLEAWQREIRHWRVVLLSLAAAEGEGCPDPRAGASRPWSVAP